MANTKNLDRNARKAAKRTARRALKDRFAALTLKDRKALRKYEGTLSAFLREKEAGEG
jgi:hypothetical protein